MHSNTSNFSARRWLKTVSSFAMLALCLGSKSEAASIVVGQVAPLTGLHASDGRGYSAGVQMYFSQINKAGGVNEHTFTLVRKDDAGRSDQTLAATEQLLAEQRVQVLAGYMGSGSLATLHQSGVLTREKMALVGYRSGTYLPDSL